MGVIDIHTHWIPPTLLQLLERREEPPRIYRRDGRKFLEFATDQEPYPLHAGLESEDAILAEMDEHGIDLSVISIVGGLSLLDDLNVREAPAVARAANDELVDLTRRHPKRFVALAALPLRSGEKAVEELEYAVGRGLKGAMVYSNVAGGPLDSDELMPVFEAAARLDVPIQIHPTEPRSRPWLMTGSATPDLLAATAGYLFDTTGAVLRLIVRGIYEDLPELKLHLCHAGSLLPYFVGRFDQFATTTLKASASKTMSAPPSEYVRMVYTDTVCSQPSALRLALEVFAPGHVMFGTDSPYWPKGPAFETVEALELSADELEQINSGNAMRVFNLEPAAV